MTESKKLVRKTKETAQMKKEKEIRTADALT